MNSFNSQGCRGRPELTANCKPPHETMNLCNGTERGTHNDGSHANDTTKCGEKLSDEIKNTEMFASSDWTAAGIPVQCTKDCTDTFPSTDWRTAATAVQPTASCWENCNCCLLGRQESCGFGNECGSVSDSCYCGNCLAECCENCSPECWGDCCDILGLCCVVCWGTSSTLKGKVKFYVLRDGKLEKYFAICNFTDVCYINN